MILPDFPAGRYPGVSGLAVPIVPIGTEISEYPCEAMELGHHA
jgi:hypothetical protein